MATPHKHAAIIKAWADGAEIESRDPIEDGGRWRVVDNPKWFLDCEYRVKPRPHKHQALIDAVMAGATDVQMLIHRKWINVRKTDGCMNNILPEDEFRRIHKWQKEMDAQAAGKMVQYFCDGKWRDGVWLFTSEHGEYRIKPESVVLLTKIVDGNDPQVGSCALQVPCAKGQENLKLTFEDGKLVKAEVI